MQPPASTPRHASAASYNPFVDSAGPVGGAAYFEVLRQPGQQGSPATFSKTVKPGVGADLLPLIHRENLLLMDMAARGLQHVAQPLEFKRSSADTPFLVTTLDAGPSLNLWRRFVFAASVAENPALTHENTAATSGFLSPQGLLQLLQHLLLALREFHAAGFVHGDIHAGNICVPFERHPHQPDWLRPVYSRLRLIDFGHTLSQRLNFDEPLPLDPDAAESLRRVSPAFRAALRQDQLAGRASAVRLLDHRLDLFALGALAQQCLGWVVWPAVEHAADPAELHSGLSRWAADLLAQDSVGPAPAAPGGGANGLHGDFMARLTRLQALADAGANGPAQAHADAQRAWLLPQEPVAMQPVAAALAHETPLAAAVAGARATPLVAVATPLALPAAGWDMPLSNSAATAGPVAGPMPLGAGAKPSSAAKRWGTGAVVALLVAASALAWLWVWQTPERAPAAVAQKPRAVPPATKPTASAKPTAPLPPAPEPTPMPTTVSVPVPVPVTVPAPNPVPDPKSTPAALPDARPTPVVVPPQPQPQQPPSAMPEAAPTASADIMVKGGAPAPAPAPSPVPVPVPVPAPPAPKPQLNEPLGAPMPPPGISVAQRPARAGVPLRVTLNLEDVGTPCGLRVSYGDGQSTDLVADSFPLALLHTYASPGRQVIRAESRFVARGLRSVGGCEGLVHRLNVDVAPALP